MHSTMQTLHSYWAYLVLLMLVIATINGVIKFLIKKEYHAKDFRIALFTLIVVHIMFLIGVVLLLVPPMGLKGVRIDHPIVMIVTAIVVTIGYSKHKKKLTSNGKFKMISIFYAIALLLCLSRIPWSNWIG